MLRSIATPSACIGCMAALAVMAAVSGYTSVVLILLTRHLTSSPPVQTLPLYFDYSSPADATAMVDLGSLLVPFPRPFSLQEYLYPSTRPLGNASSSSQQQQQKQQQQQQEQAEQEQEQEQRPSPPVCTEAEQQEQHPVAQLALAQDTQSRLLSPAQRVRVSVRLRLPSTHKDLFQLSGQLLSGGGRVLERAVRTHMAVDRPLLRRLIRQLTLSPCVAVGWCSDAVSVTFVLFEAFCEQQIPLQGFRAALTSRQSVAGTLPPPAILQADLKLELHMGTLRRLLYWLRPSLPVTLVLTSLASLLALTGSALSVFLALLCLVMRALSQQQQAAPAPPVPVAPVPAPALPAAAAEPAPRRRQSFPGLLGPPRRREPTEPPGARNGGVTAGAKPLTEPGSEEADLQWQMVEEEQYHEADETWT